MVNYDLEWPHVPSTAGHTLSEEQCTNHHRHNANKPPKRVPRNRQDHHTQRPVHFATQPIQNMRLAWRRGEDKLEHLDVLSL